MALNNQAVINEIRKMPFDWDKAVDYNSNSNVRVV